MAANEHRVLCYKTEDDFCDEKPYIVRPFPDMETAEVWAVMMNAVGRYVEIVDQNEDIVKTFLPKKQTTKREEDY